MSMHKLTAGSGYDYLTRQVAVQDATDKGHTSLASYYTEKGETPGVWMGSGLAGIEGLELGDVVTAEQMQALFGSGHHPLAEQRRAALPDDATPAEVQVVTRLGTPFKVYADDIPPLRVEVARRLEGLNVAAGLPRDYPVDSAVRARVRTEVGRDLFVAEHGREPSDARELAAVIARHSRPKTTAVAGFDLAFSPVKSVSALWAIAEPDVAAKIERAHHAAVKDALDFLESHALFTREGTNGARQVDVSGLIGAAFTHRDSRAGDPDLHTHVAIPNKVQTLDGKWLAIDGRVLFKAKVTISETYNTALERHAVALGMRFAVRPDADKRKRPVREIVGVDLALNQRWSTRRVSIDARRAELAATFQADHGRPPTPTEILGLAQRATLETREPKHEPRTLGEQRQAWRAQAIEVLGSPRALDRMVSKALHPRHAVGDEVTARWIAETAGTVINVVQQSRSTWQTWHLRAEAHRRIRDAAIPAGRAETVVDLVVDEALAACVPLVTDRDGIDEPALLRRADGSSVYHVAGSDLFTSQAILDAEARILAAAARTGGRRVPADVVDLALLESTANELELNPGQAALVRQMATSGARVQLAIAPAGSGKTSAMGVLTRAWIEGGGNVIGFAPSAAAASVLREQTGATSDTLAKLVLDVRTGNRHLPGKIGHRTLVLIDEAGMADTLTLDSAIRYILKRGASVRLIGDNQQLAAIGAGGVLRDIDHTHGAFRLSELMRFAEVAEGAATLALRDGHPEALGFYLDHQRIGVGDLATMTETVFTSWQTDRNAGLDAVMLALTRDQVADLNARARAARLAETGSREGPTVRLADGNQASAGDVVITRMNERKLPISATDWVKNNYRWHVTGVKGDQLVVRHTTSGLRVTLPAAYVAQNTELGYASTVHTAQGLSVDTVHGLLTGTESRQQFYTMLTRGRSANHAYLVVTGDGDEHNLIRPETIHPKTATDILESILARDETPVSATTTAREASDPATLLGPATARYVDALYRAAEHHITPERVAEIEQAADDLVPGIGDEPAWPVLRAHLILIEAGGHHATGELSAAVAERELDGVQDRAAVLDWRLDPTGARNTRLGPLPWVPAVPDQLGADSTWGPYLAARADRVRTLAVQVHAATIAGETPEWARQGTARPGTDLLGDVTVWRAATGVDPADRRPTGGPQLQKAAVTYQRRLNERLNTGRTPAIAEWGPAIDGLQPRRDQFTPLLAERLAALGRASINAAALLHRAAGEGPLPDDHASAALWWRINRHLSPAVAADATNSNHTLGTNWTPVLVEALGADQADQVQASSWWPTLVTQIDHATARGWAIRDLLAAAQTRDVEDVDPAQAMLWRIGILTNPPPVDPDPYDDNPPPADLADLTDVHEPATHHASVSEVPTVDEQPDLEQVAFSRSLLDPLEPTDSDTDVLLDRANTVRLSAVAPERILAINALTANYFEHQLAGSWAHAHLLERFGQDLAGDPRYRPGHAPAGWTNLVNHLRHHGVTDDEMLATGVASTASTGRLIDRFRDRLVLPIINDSKVLGFVGRGRPDATDDTNAGPKYLNTPETIAFHKGAQLYGIAQPHMADGSVPVLVEGPMDAIAVTLATAGAYLGVAPLGTSLTTEQAHQIAQFGTDPIVATDGDLAGHVAAERDYWLLTPHGLDPRHAALAPGEDPASLLTNQGPTPLQAALHNAGHLAHTLIDERLTNLRVTGEQVTAATDVIAAGPPHHWQTAITAVASRLGIRPEAVRDAVARAGHAWNTDPRRASTRQLNNSHAVRTRLQTATAAPVERWATLAKALDPRLVGQPDWPATAAMLQQVADAGHHLPTLTQQLVAQAPLGEQPAQDLRYRLVSYLPDDNFHDSTPIHDTTSQGIIDHHRRMPPIPTRRPDVGPRR